MENITHYHFAYADHMNEENVHQICPGAKFESIAELPGYRLIFNRLGMATLVSDSSSSVWGVVWCLSMRDIYNLEKNEEAHLPNFKRINVFVNLPDGRNLEAFSYITLITEEGKPNYNQLENIIELAEYWALPANYIKSLRDLLPASK